MSDKDKKNKDYEKPESQKIGGEDLEDVSGGTGAEFGPCKTGYDAKGHACGQGMQPTSCKEGAFFGEGDCTPGVHPSGSCRSGQVL